MEQQEKEEVITSSQIKVCNLSADSCEDEVRRFFERYGKVQKCFLLNSDGGQQSCALVTFDSVEVARSTLINNKKIFKGRLIELSSSALPYTEEGNDSVVKEIKSPDLIVPQIQKLEKERKSITSPKSK